MTEFKKKPKPKTSEEFHQILDEVNGGDIEVEPQKLGRPTKATLDKAQRLSVSIKHNDMVTINQFKDRLLSLGFNSPYPTNSDIIKMALRKLAFDTDTYIEQLYKNIKNNFKYLNCKSKKTYFNTFIKVWKKLKIKKTSDYYKYIVIFLWFSKLTKIGKK